MVQHKADPAGDCALFERQLALTVDLLRTLPLDRLGREDAKGESPAGRAFRLSEEMVAQSRRLQRAREPTCRTVARLAPAAAGDQLAVVGRELLGAIGLGSVEDATGGLRVLASMTDRLRDLRNSV